MRKIWILFFVTLIATVFSLQNVHALSCAEIPKPYLNHYDAAVLGTVKNVKSNLEQEGFTSPKEYSMNVLMEVEKSWKREMTSEIIFKADYTWGYPYENGKKYLVYLNEDKKSIYYNSPCSEVIEITKQENMDEMGEAFIPKEKVDLSHQMQWMSSYDFDKEILLCMILLVIISIFWFRKKKKRGE